MTKDLTVSNVLKWLLVRQEVGQQLHTCLHLYLKYVLPAGPIPTALTFVTPLNVCLTILYRIKLQQFMVPWKRGCVLKRGELNPLGPIAPKGA